MDDDWPPPPTSESWEANNWIVGIFFFFLTGDPSLESDYYPCWILINKTWATRGSSVVVGFPNAVKTLVRGTRPLQREIIKFSNRFPSFQIASQDLYSSGLLLGTNYFDLAHLSDLPLSIPRGYCPSSRADLAAK